MQHISSSHLDSYLDAATEADSSALSGRIETLPNKIVTVLYTHDPKFRYPLYWRESEVGF